MPNVTVVVVGGTEEENLTAITVGARRWGSNGAQWGATQTVPAGKDIEVRAYYSGQPASVIAYFDLDQGGATLEITADGPEATPVEVVDE